MSSEISILYIITESKRNAAHTRGPAAGAPAAAAFGYIPETDRREIVMSQTAMWLLLVVVIVAIVFVSVLYKRKFTVKELATIGIMAAQVAKASGATVADRETAMQMLDALDKLAEETC